MLLRGDGFYGFLFLYFLTLHADRLGCTIGFYNFRLNNLIALCCAILFYVRFRHRLFSLDSHFARALIYLSCSLLLSFLFSSYLSRTGMFLVWYLFTIVGYVLLPYWVVQLCDVHRVFSLYLWSFVWVGLYALGQLLCSWCGWNDPFAQQRIMQEHIVRPNAFAYEPSFYVLYMTPFIMMCNFHYIFSPHRPFFCFQKLGPVKLLFFNSLYLVSVSTSTICAYLFFLGGVMLRTSRGIRLRMFQISLLLASILFLVWLCFPVLIKAYFLRFLFEGFTEQATFYERWGGIVNAWQVFMRYPLIGLGLGAYPLFLMDAWLADDATFRFFAVYFTQVKDATGFLKIFEPANVCTEILASLGIVGCGAFLYLFTVFWRRAKQVQNLHIDAANLAFSVVITLLVLQINQGLLRTYIWVHFALVFAYIEKISTQEKNQPVLIS